MMKKIYDHLLGVIGSRRLRTPKDVAMRLAYKGPAHVEAAIQHGEEPTSISWAPEAVNRWVHAVNQVKQAVV